MITEWIETEKLLLILSLYSLQIPFILKPPSTKYHPLVKLMKIFFIHTSPNKYMVNVQNLFNKFMSNYSIFLNIFRFDFSWKRICWCNSKWHNQYDVLQEQNMWKKNIRKTLNIYSNIYDLVNFFLSVNVFLKNWNNYFKINQ